MSPRPACRRPRGACSLHPQNGVLRSLTSNPIPLTHAQFMAIREKSPWTVSTLHSFTEHRTTHRERRCRIVRVVPCPPLEEFAPARRLAFRGASRFRYRCQCVPPLRLEGDLHPQEGRVRVLRRERRNVVERGHCRRQIAT